MITIKYTQESEYIGDEYFPEAKGEFIFDDETTSTDILTNVIKLLRFAGYPLPSEEDIDALKEELDYKELLRR